MTRLKISLLLLVLCFVPVVSQNAAQNSAEECPTIAEDILRDVDEICAGTGRNQACYGNLAMEVMARDGVMNFAFSRVGDIVNVADIATLRLSPLDEKNNAWGVAMMRLQANIPDTLPGQNVTFILFGDVELTNAVSPDSTTARPMQAFYMTTGVGNSGCATAPESGMLVQTPEGVGEVAFSVNGVNISLGSTVFLSAPRDDATGRPEMSIKTLEGMATTMIDDTLYPILCGTQLSVALGDDLLPADLPGDLKALEDNLLSLIPIDLLEEREWARPATDEQLAFIIDHIKSGGALCGEDPFPSCEDAPWLEDWQMPDLQWGEDGFGDAEWQNVWENREWQAVFDDMRANLLANFDPDEYSNSELRALLETLDQDEFADFMENFGGDLSDDFWDSLDDRGFDFAFDRFDALDNLDFGRGRRGDDDAMDDAEDDADSEDDDSYDDAEDDD